MLRKVLSVVTACAIAASMVACAPKAPAPSAEAPAASTEAPAASTEVAATEKPATEPSAEKVITVMHNNPDTSSPTNQYYQAVADKIMKDNPGSKVNMEVYDNETYKKKLQIYASTKTMPDVFFVWSNPSEFLPYVNAGVAAELNAADFQNYNFTPGALEGATVNGKLVGLPILIDYWYLYYNKKVFDDNAVAVPKTIGELKTAIKTFNGKGIAPIAMNGKDLWNQSVLFNDILLRFTNGNPKPIWDATAGVTKFATTPEFTEAANAYKELVDLGMFQKSWASDDGDTAKNLFLQGKSAMLYIGTWENAMCTTESVSKEVRDNMRIIPFPSKDGTDTSKALMGREGTTMMVAENSQNKDLAISYLKGFFDPTEYPKAFIQKQIGIPMQSFDKFVADDSPALIKEVAKSISESTSLASHPFSFRLSAVFEQESKDLNMSFLLGQTSVEELWKATDESAAANQVK